MTENKKAELLAPSGNFDCVKAAVNAGADAVYLGGQLFNARAYAANFDLEELERVCGFCHSFFVKVYVTVNTLYKDAEFESLLPYIDALYAMGVDGLIMQDLGAIAQVRRMWPDLPVHASTQLTANGIDDVHMLESLGISTVVLSRELSLDEIRRIAAASKARLEVFIHGALCVSYSGQCLMSSVLGNRSGNRGRCAQNCRLRYSLLQENKEIAEGHLLSTKDICTLPLLPELLQSGVASLKIEGRMKSPEYVAGVTGIYRKYLDRYYSGASCEVDPQDVLILQQLFNRGAFSEGYLKTHSGLSMMCPTHPRAWGVPAGKVLGYDRKSHRVSVLFEKAMVPGDGIEIRTDQEEGCGTYLNRPAAAGERTSLIIDGAVKKDQEVYQTYDKRLMDELKAKYETVTRKVPLDLAVRIRSGEPAELKASAGGQTVSVCGAIPLPAKNQALTAETVRDQLRKLGGTVYRLNQLNTDLEDGLFLNRSELNALRNLACEALTDAIRKSGKRSARGTAADLPETAPAAGQKRLSVTVRTDGQFRAALRCDAVSVIYAEMRDELMDQIQEMTEAAHERGIRLFVKLPRIWRSYVRENCSAALDTCLRSEVDGFLISSPGHYQAVKDSGKAFSVDFTGNVFNSRTFAFWKSLGAERIALSPEMSLEEINGLADRSRAEILAYGYLPLMVTHQCPIGNFAGGKQDRLHCRRAGHQDPWYLRTKTDQFRLDTDCRNCVCTVLSTEPLDLWQGVQAFDADLFRVDFTVEDDDVAGIVLKFYRRFLKYPPQETYPRLWVYEKSVL